MKDWIPLLQTLVWPVFLGLLILFYRKWFHDVLNLIKERIEAGSEFNLGPSGVGIGAAPKLPDEPEADDIIDDGTEVSSPPDLIEKEKQLEEEAKIKPEKSLQLVHRTSFLRIKSGRLYYRIYVSLDSLDPDALSSVERVVYYLHRTFRNPVREITNAETNFTLKTAAWGEFTIRAEVYLKGKPEPLRLSRYITIDTRS